MQCNGFTGNAHGWGMLKMGDFVSHSTLHRIAQGWVPGEWLERRSPNIPNDDSLIFCEFITTDKSTFPLSL